MDQTMSPRRALCLIGLLVLAAGCRMSNSSILTVLEMASIMNTDRTLSDHAYSFFTGKDCSTLYLANGGAMCKEDEILPPAPPPVYCYRTLADITCYDRPDPYDNNHRAVGQSPLLPVR